MNRNAAKKMLAAMLSISLQSEIKAP
jgi:hypothetical protein